MLVKQHSQLLVIQVVSSAEFQNQSQNPCPHRQSWLHFLFALGSVSLARIECHHKLRNHLKFLYHHYCFQNCLPHQSHRFDYKSRAFRKSFCFSLFTNCFCSALLKLKFKERIFFCHHVFSTTVSHVTLTDSHTHSHNAECRNMARRRCFPAFNH